MLRPPLIAEYSQPGVYTFTPLKGFPGTGILSSPPNLLPTLSTKPVTPVLPTATTIISPPLTPVVFSATTSLKSTQRIRKFKPAPTTVREMLKSRKQMLMERQAVEAYQASQSARLAHQTSYVRSVHLASAQSTGGGRTKGLSGRRKGGSSAKHSKNVIAEDKKAMHRVNERQRHQNMNQALQELVAVLPKNTAPETETKHFVLHKANVYLNYLKDKISNVCSEMDVTPEEKEGGLMGFDIPFKRDTGKKVIEVAPSAAVTYSDLQNLLGPTAALNISEPPKRKHSKQVEKIKPKSGTGHHQPWLEINIKVRVSPGKNDPSKTLGTTRAKTARKPSGKKKKAAVKKKSLVKIPKRVGKPRSDYENAANQASCHRQEKGRYWSYDGPSLIGSSNSQARSTNSQWLTPEATVSDQNIVSSSQSSVTPYSAAEYDRSQSSLECTTIQSGESLISSPPMITSSSAGFYQNQSNGKPDGHYLAGSSKSLSINTPSSTSTGFDQNQSCFITPEGAMTNFHQSPLEEGELVDLTCIDVLSPEDDESTISASTTSPEAHSFTNKDLNFPFLDVLDSSTPDLHDKDSLPLIRYRSSSPDDVMGADSLLQTEHSYSARFLSPDILKTISASQLQNVFADTDLVEYGKRDKKEEKPKFKVVKKTRQISPPYEPTPPDSVLQAVVLMEPPPDCVPPNATHSDGDIDTIKALGLDFDEDSDSSLGSFSQRSSPELHVVDGTAGAENVDPVITSFATQQSNSSIRRSWINGYQLFTKINHQRIKSSWPRLQGREITRLLGQSWKDLPEDYKKMYSMRACDWNKWHRHRRSVAQTTNEAGDSYYDGD